MTPEEHSAVRAGLNLATLPADVRAEIAADRAWCLQVDAKVKQEASRICLLSRFKAEAALRQLGDLEPLVRAQLNTMKSRGKRERNENGQ